MDWKYKHFKHEAVFKAPRQNVLETARAVVAESLGAVEDTNDGFVARGDGAWHAAIATVRLASTSDGTLLAVELQVERAAMRGYMLVDIGGYYDGQIDKWFVGIAQHLGRTSGQVLVSKTTASVQARRGCLTGCLVYLMVGACLGMLAIPFKSMQAPLALMASVIGLLAGVGAFLYVLYPESSTAKFVRQRLTRTPGQEQR